VTPARLRFGLAVSGLSLACGRSQPADAYDAAMTATTDILQSIENRIQEVQNEIDTLTTARAALLNGEGPANARVKAAPRAATARRSARRSRTAAATTAAVTASSPDPAAAAAAAEPSPAASPAPAEPSRAAASPRRAARGGRRAKPQRKTEIVPAGKLELLLADTGGLTTSALAEQSNGNRDQVLTLLRELESAGRIRRSGQRRSTRWHVITDEDRVAQRAAELAARRKNAA
jgi:hypothetical protein